MSPPDTWIHGTPGNPFTGHQVDEKNHTLGSLEDNISIARPSATLFGRPEGWPGQVNEAGGRAISQDDDALVPWELAAHPMLQ